MIHVQPAQEMRVDFAVWAVAQTPKIRTVSTNSFAVPPRLFVEVPEEILIGALVNGHRYVSPDEDAATGQPPPGTPPAPAPGSPEADAAAMVAATSPETVQAAMDAALLAVDLAALNAGGDEPGSELPAGGDNPATPEEQPDGVFLCPGCPKEFTTARGRDTHARQVHPTGRE
ncbi:hypothetical protein [Actinacidiphila sp. ITFR-21]|uniref:hypothetical protein n=1 Tax=Actinacidiphila sp. ITFR-21 TaxID=3075199 RepID=UPI002889D0E0|nr:hypothetical protein [Streptomyces sp. ITFR-21]WNI20273.1 hypothetical protein RLT57_32930 [Streptomyces sp. ITFR-21]